MTSDMSIIQSYYQYSLYPLYLMPRRILYPRQTIALQQEWKNNAIHYIIKDSLNCHPNGVGVAISFSVDINLASTLAIVIISMVLFISVRYIVRRNNESVENIMYQRNYQAAKKVNQIPNCQAWKKLIRPPIYCLYFFVNI